MDFFNKLGKQISDGANAVANKTKDFAGVTKINIQISQDEGKLISLYSELGKIFYVKNSANPTDEFSASFAEISSLQSKIEAAKLQIQQIKGTKFCESCGAEFPSNLQFCGSCGAKAPEVVVESFATVVETNPTVTCPTCGKAEDASTLFCSGCGHKF